MGRMFRWNVGVTLLGNAPITLIITWLLNAFFKWGASESRLEVVIIMPTVVITAIAFFAIGYLILYVDFLEILDMFFVPRDSDKVFFKKHEIESGNACNGWRNYWLKKIKKQQPVSSGSIYFVNFLHFVLAAIGVALTYYFLGGERIYLIAFSSFATFQFLYAVRLLFWTPQIKCNNCKKVYCFIVEKTLDVNSYEYTDYKNKNRNVHVGEIYVERNKIGDVYQNQNVQYTRQNKVFSDKLSCRCVYCGKEREDYDVTVFGGQWE